MSDPKAKENKKAGQHSGGKVRRTGNLFFTSMSRLSGNPRNAGCNFPAGVSPGTALRLHAIRARIARSNLQRPIRSRAPRCSRFCRRFRGRLCFAASAQTLDSSRKRAVGARSDGRRKSAGTKSIAARCAARVIARAGQRQWCAADATGKYDFWFDLPYDWSKKVRHLHISGWCRADGWKSDCRSAGHGFAARFFQENTASRDRMSPPLLKTKKVRCTAACSSMPLFPRAFRI